MQVSDVQHMLISLMPSIGCSTACACARIIHKPHQPDCLNGRALLHTVAQKTFEGMMNEAAPSCIAPVA